MSEISHVKISPVHVKAPSSHPLLRQTIVLCKLGTGNELDSLQNLIADATSTRFRCYGHEVAKTFCYRDLFFGVGIDLAVKRFSGWLVGSLAIARRSDRGSS